MLRPVQELAGFRRIHLKAGEETQVTFCFRASQASFIRPDGAWVTEAGVLELRIGASSEDIRLRGEIRVTDTLVTDGRERAFYA